MAGLRLILAVAVEPGNRHTSKHSDPHLWGLLGRLGRDCWPQLVRGDKDWGTERNMARCEQEGVDSLFTLCLTKGGAGSSTRRWGRPSGRTPVRAGGAARRNCAWRAGAGRAG